MNEPASEECNLPWYESENEEEDERQREESRAWAAESCVFSTPARSCEQVCTSRRKNAYLPNSDNRRRRGHNSTRSSHHITHTSPSAISSKGIESGASEGVPALPSQRPTRMGSNDMNSDKIVNPGILFRAKESREAWTSGMCP